MKKKLHRRQMFITITPISLCAIHNSYLNIQLNKKANNAFTGVNIIIFLLILTTFEHRQLCEVNFSEAMSIKVIHTKQ